MFTISLSASLWCHLKFQLQCSSCEFHVNLLTSEVKSKSQQCREYSDADCIILYVMCNVISLIWFISLERFCPFIWICHFRIYVLPKEIRIWRILLWFITATAKVATICWLRTVCGFIIQLLILGKLSNSWTELFTMSFSWWECHVIVNVSHRESCFLIIWLINCYIAFICLYCIHYYFFTILKITSPIGKLYNKPNISSVLFRTIIPSSK